MYIHVYIYVYLGSHMYLYLCRSKNLVNRCDVGLRPLSGLSRLLRLACDASVVLPPTRCRQQQRKRHQRACTHPHPSVCREPKSKRHQRA